MQETVLPFQDAVKDWWRKYCVSWMPIKTFQWFSTACLITLVLTKQVIVDNSQVSIGILH